MRTVLMLMLPFEARPFRWAIFTVMSFAVGMLVFQTSFEGRLLGGFVFILFIFLVFRFLAWVWSWSFWPWELSPWDILSTGGLVNFPEVGNPWKDYGRWIRFRSLARAIVAYNGLREQRGELPVVSTLTFKNDQLAKIEFGGGLSVIFEIHLKHNIVSVIKKGTSLKEQGYRSLKLGLLYGWEDFYIVDLLQMQS